jgi:hypothetical protein
MLRGRSGDSHGSAACELAAGVTILREKIEHLNRFALACKRAGLADELEIAALAAHAFANKCVALNNARGKLDQVTGDGLRSQYKEATSNLMTLAISTNSAGINLQAEARDIFETINDLMETMGLAPEERSSGEPS